MNLICFWIQTNFNHQFHIWSRQLSKFDFFGMEVIQVNQINPIYDNWLFIELQEIYKFSIWCVHKLWFCFGNQNNLYTQHVLNLYFSCNSMTNLLSNYWIIDAIMRASEKYLPVCTLSCKVEKNALLVIRFIKELP